MIGGLIADAFKIFLGNPDVMIPLLVFTVFVGFVFSILAIQDYMDS